MTKKGGTLTDKQLMDGVEKGDIKPVYFLYGDEGYGLDLLSDFFETKVVPEENQPFDQTVVYGRDVRMSSVIDSAKQFPTFPTTTRRLILIKEAQGIEKDDLDLLPPYLEHPSTTSVIVFVFRMDEKEFNKKTSKVIKAVTTHGAVVAKNRPYEDKVAGWILNYTAGQGYKISLPSATLIAEALGNDTGKIANELSKVFITLPQGGVVTNEIIERNIGISKDYNVFELQKALGEKDVLKCNRIVNHFAANPKDNPIQMVLPNLYSYFIKVMIYQQLTDKSSHSVASALGINPYFIGDYKTAARNYSLPKMAAIIGYLKEADLKSKGMGNTGTITDGELIKELVFKILH